MTSRKQEIIEQAMALVIREGIAALTMKHVAQQVGFTEAAMYRHFRNKRELVISLIRMIRGQFDEMFASNSFEQKPVVYFKAILSPMLGYLEQVRGVTFQFLSESTYNRDEVIRGELNGFYSSLVDRITDYLKSSRKRGEIRKEVDCEAAAILFTGIIQSLTIRYLLSNQTAGLQEKGKNVLDVYLRGVLA
jgi:AcrR family transcriptional regulator